MKIDPQQATDIARDERWLSSFPKPSPSSERLDRVKAAVRQVCGREPGVAPDDAAAALARTKVAVRRKLGADTSVRTLSRRSGSGGRRGTQVRRAPRRWVPLAAAAALGLAMIGLRSVMLSDSSDARDLDRFVEVMEQEPDETEATLMELRWDIEDLERDAFGLAAGRWSDPLLDGAGDALDELSSDPSERAGTS